RSSRACCPSARSEVARRLASREELHAVASGEIPRFGVIRAALRANVVAPAVDAAPGTGRARAERGRRQGTGETRTTRWTPVPERALEREGRRTSALGADAPQAPARARRAGAARARRPGHGRAHRTGRAGAPGDRARRKWPYRGPAA